MKGIHSVLGCLCQSETSTLQSNLQLGLLLCRPDFYHDLQSPYNVQMYLLGLLFRYVEESLFPNIDGGTLIDDLLCNFFDIVANCDPIEFFKPIYFPSQLSLFDHSLLALLSLFHSITPSTWKVCECTLWKRLISSSKTCEWALIIDFFTNFAERGLFLLSFVNHKIGSDHLISSYVLELIPDLLSNTLPSPIHERLRLLSDSLIELSRRNGISLDAAQTSKLIEIPAGPYENFPFKSFQIIYYQFKSGILWNSIPEKVQGEFIETTRGLIPNQTMEYHSFQSIYLFLNPLLTLMAQAEIVGRHALKDRARAILIEKKSVFKSAFNQSLEMMSFCGANNLSFDHVSRRSPSNSTRVEKRVQVC